MIWQDYAILASQAVMLIALYPTLRDRRRWPHRTTAAVTGASLIVLGLSLATLNLWLSTAIVAGTAMTWLWMSAGASFSTEELTDARVEAVARHLAAKSATDPDAWIPGEGSEPSIPVWRRHESDAKAIVAAVDAAVSR